MIYEFLTLEQIKHKYDLYIRLKNNEKIGSERRMKFRQKAQYYADLYNVTKPMRYRKLKVK